MIYDGYLGCEEIARVTGPTYIVTGFRAFVFPRGGVSQICESVSEAAAMEAAERAIGDWVAGMHLVPAV